MKTQKAMGPIQQPKWEASFQGRPPNALGDLDGEVGFFVLLAETGLTMAPGNSA
jgi:hypothetical protein